MREVKESQKNSRKTGVNIHLPTNQQIIEHNVAFFKFIATKLTRIKKGKRFVVTFSVSVLL
jgi:hypothetical protein